MWAHPYLRHSKTKGAAEHLLNKELGLLCVRKEGSSPTYTRRGVRKKSLANWSRLTSTTMGCAASGIGTSHHVCSSNALEEP